MCPDQRLTCFTNLCNVIGTVNEILRLLASDRVPSIPEGLLARRVSPVVYRGRTSLPAWRRPTGTTTGEGLRALLTSNLVRFPFRRCVSSVLLRFSRFLSNEFVNQLSVCVFVLALRYVFPDVFGSAVLFDVRCLLTCAIPQRSKLVSC